MSKPKQKALEERDKQREFQREQTERQAKLQEAFNSSGDLSRDWMREVLGVEKLEERLQRYTIPKIQAMLNEQWILSHLTDAETHDRVWWLEVQKLKIFGEHPPNESVITGEMRAYLLDDESEQLQPLTASERNAIDQLIKTLQNMVTRSRGGFERKQENTRIAATQSEDTTSSDEGRMRGLFE